MYASGMNHGGHGLYGLRSLAIVAAGALVVAACATAANTTDPAGPGSASSTVSVSFVTSTTGVEEQTDPSTQPASEVFVPLNLDIGTCFDDVPADTELVTPDSVPVVECAAAHDNEVFANFDVGTGEFPGASEIQAMSDSLCFGAFESYIGGSYDTSVYDFSWYFPTRDSWDVGGTNIICFAYNIELTKISGSINGSDQ